MIRSTLTDEEIGQVYRAFESSKEYRCLDKCIADAAATKERERIIDWIYNTFDEIDCPLDIGARTAADLLGSEE